MIALSGQLRAWLELARISNAPTVIGNVLAGAAIGAHASGRPLEFRSTALVSLGAVLLYTAGMVLNDAIDAPTDRIERPQRPIPSGRIPRLTALAVAISLLVVGVATMFWAGTEPGFAALALAGAIVLYDLIHQHTVLSVLVMGLCRALVYCCSIAAYVSLSGRFDLAMPGIMLALYTAGFSIVARSESEPRPVQRRVLAWLPVPLGLAVVVAAAHQDPPQWAWALVPTVALLLAARRASAPVPQTRRAILTFIAGFCLIDAAVCAALSQYQFAVACLGLWCLTAWSHRRILGT